MTTDTTPQYVRIRHDGVVTWVILARPERRNAMGLELCQQLEESLREVLASDDVRLLVLSAEGPAFCAGADLKEELDDEGRLRRGEYLVNSIMLLWESAIPVVARVQGPARGGAAGLVAACDIVVAADDVTFGFPEVRIGAVPAIIAPPILARCRWNSTLEFFLTGEVFDAALAADMGLVSRVVPAAELDEAVEEYGDMLLRGSPASLAITRRLVRSQAGIELGEAMRDALHTSAAAFASEDASAARRAAAAGLPPPWAALDGTRA